MPNPLYLSLPSPHIPIPTRNFGGNFRAKQGRQAVKGCAMIEDTWMSYMIEMDVLG